MIRRLVFSLILLTLSMCGVVFAQTGGIAIPVVMQAPTTVTGATIASRGTVTRFDPVSGTELRNAQSAICEANVTAIAGTAATTFLVTLQACPDSTCLPGAASDTGWDAFGTFTDLHAGGRSVLNWSSGTAPIGANVGHAIALTLAAGNVRGGPYGPMIRVYASSTGGDGTTSITYRVDCYFESNV